MKTLTADFAWRILEGWRWQKNFVPFETPFETRGLKFEPLKKFHLKCPPDSTVGQICPTCAVLLRPMKKRRLSVGGGGGVAEA
jgi:hypothetical protein